MTRSAVSGRALFLYLEKKEMPLHIGSAFIFDGPLPDGRLRVVPIDWDSAWLQRQFSPPAYVEPSMT